MRSTRPYPSKFLFITSGSSRSLQIIKQTNEGKNQIIKKETMATKKRKSLLQKISIRNIFRTHSPQSQTEQAVEEIKSIPKKMEPATVAGIVQRPVRPFRVCTDMKLGPFLPPVVPLKNDHGGKIPFFPKDGNFLCETWEQIKRKDGNKPTHVSVESRRWGACLLNDIDNINSTKTKIEAISNFDGDPKLKNCVPVFVGFNSINLFAKAVHTAFYQHYPLRLSPDVIWLTILQGLAKHIDQDPERQRKNLVDFEGKKTLTVIREEFVKGSPQNDWTTVFPEFAGMIEKYIGTEKATAMACDFTTSSPTDKICSNIALMDAVKHYFEYEMMCGCGIPSIELTGTVGDWVSLRSKADILSQFDDLEWWTSELFPVLDHFVEAAKGNPDIRFWKSVCNLYGLSGFWQDYVTGWVQVFFPYTANDSRSWALGEWRTCYEEGTGTEIEDYNRGIEPMGCCVDNGVGSGLKLEDIPVGFNQAPLKYVDLPTGKKYDMTFNAGIVAIFQNKKTRALEPVTGWAVLDHGEVAN